MALPPFSPSQPSSYRGCQSTSSPKFTGARRAALRQAQGERLLADSMSEHQSTLLRLLDGRGYIHQANDLAGLRCRRSEVSMVPGYVGFDATAPSLHVGNLVSIMLLRRLATGRAQADRGDGRRHDAGRRSVGQDRGTRQDASMMTRPSPPTSRRIERTFARFLKFGDGPSDAVLVNNADWLDALGYIELLRERGSALHTESHVDLRLRADAAGTGAAADLPGVQLHDSPGLRLRGAMAAARLPVAAGRVGPVGQHQ